MSDSPRPCQCPQPNPECLRSGRPTIGRLWQLCSGTNCPAALSEAYRRRWDGLPTANVGGLSVQTQPKRAKALPRLPCRHQGEPTGERVACIPCGGNIRLKVFHCLAGHGEITTRDCATCADYLPPAPAGAEDHLARLEAAVKNTPPRPELAGRGIVVGTGGSKYFACAFVALHVLRKTGCTLPVEWWHLGRSEIDPAMRRLAEAEGVRVVDALEVRQQHPARILNGWELKPYSILHSGLREVLYLDADCVPALDPTYLFDAQQYRHTGAIFWPDIPPSDRPEWLPPVVWANVGLPVHKETDFETGQLLIHKEKCWQALNVTMHMNEWSDWYYQFVFGDKSTFHLAWRKCGQDYAMPPGGARWTWPTFEHRDFQGRVVFNHCCRGKEMLAEGKHIAAVRRSQDAQQGARLLADRWRGLIWSWHDQTAEETALARSLCHRWRYVRDGKGQRTLELLAGGGIGQGEAGCEKRWTLRILDGVPTLVIVGEAHKGSEIGMMFLTEEAGCWVGRWEAHERGPVALEP